MKMKLIGLCALASMFVGCGSLSSVGSDGRAVGNLVWPNPDSVTLDHHRGTYGDMNRISLLRSGATRDDIYQAIGRPHFNEGFKAREWDYLFYFQEKDGSELTCQYKILFDSSRVARQFSWRTVSPAGAACPPGQKVSLSGDTLFRLNGARSNDLLPGAKVELDQLAGNIVASPEIKSVEIFGYTDRLGSAAYNQKLSQERADTVKSYLIMQGVNAGLISAMGMGEANPVVQCDGIANRAALIDCLQPNRRVEVEIKR